MKEAEYEFYSDIKSKALTAQGAKHVGVRRDNNKKYSKKELREKNGGTFIMNMNKFITYKKFRKLPDNMKKQYIEHQIEKYGVGQSTFARFWEVSQSTTWNLFRRLNIVSPVYDGAKAELFMNEMKPDKAPKPEKVEEVAAPVEIPAEVHMAADVFEPIKLVRPKIAIDHCTINTDIKFEDTEDMVDFFTRFIPIRKTISLDMVVDLVKGDK